MILSFEVPNFLLHFYLSSVETKLGVDFFILFFFFSEGGGGGGGVHKVLQPLSIRCKLQQSVGFSNIFGIYVLNSKLKANHIIKMSIEIFGISIKLSKYPSCTNLFIFVYKFKPMTLNIIKEFLYYYQMNHKHIFQKCYNTKYNISHASHVIQI